MMRVLMYVSEVTVGSPTGRHGTVAWLIFHWFRFWGYHFFLIWRRRFIKESLLRFEEYSKYKLQVAHKNIECCCYCES